jgi:hypothetical protein
MSGMLGRSQCCYLWELESDRIDLVRFCITSSSPTESGSISEGSSAMFVWKHSTWYHKLARRVLGIKLNTHLNRRPCNNWNDESLPKITPTLCKVSILSIRVSTKGLPCNNRPSSLAFCFKFATVTAVATVTDSNHHCLTVDCVISPSSSKRLS